MFTDCEDCGKDLNVIEKEFCLKMHLKTNMAPSAKMCFTRSVKYNNGQTSC